MSEVIDYDKFCIECKKTAHNANSIKERLTNTNFINAWRTAYVLWQDAYAVMDIAIMFEQFSVNNYIATTLLEKTMNDNNYMEEQIFFLRKSLNESKKHLIDVLRWNQEIKNAGCDGIRDLSHEVDRFVKLIDSYIDYLLCD